MSTDIPISQRIWGGLFSLFPIPRKLNGTTIDRVQPCRICSCKQGEKISEVHYWDLMENNLVRCPGCNLTQLDPMLTEENTAAGCLAYYIQETLAEKPGSRNRNCVRNFRRGVAFGSRLKSLGIKPGRVMELGPGSGYFSAGLQYVFPRIEVTVVDIVDDILRKIEEHHGFKTIKATPETINVENYGKFDLIVARDIIEHVGDISATIENICRLLSSGGYFHFITPNGYENVWSAYARWKLTGQPAELLINHVNYFDAAGLRAFLISKGLHPISYYNYTVKFTRRGEGWRLREKNASAVSTKKSASKMIKLNANRLKSIGLSKKSILGEWWMNSGCKWLAPYYCRFKDMSIIQIDPETNVGHEIFGLMQKR